MNEWTEWIFQFSLEFPPTKPLSLPACTSVTLRVCPQGQRSAIAVNYTACPTRLRASGPLVINERSNLLPAKARANSLSLVKLGSKASPD